MRKKKDIESSFAGDYNTDGWNFHQSRRIKAAAFHSNEKAESDFQELESENEKLLILEKEAAKLSSKQERMKEDFESKIDYMWETYEITYNQAFTLKHYEVKAEEAAEQRKQKKNCKDRLKNLEISISTPLKNTKRLARDTSSYEASMMISKKQKPNF